jgi:hypothetical protein
VSQQPPEVLDQASQILMELGRRQARIEELEARLAAQQATEETTDEARKRKLAIHQSGPVCTLRWILQPQGKVLIGTRVYTGHGPVKDRTTGRITHPGSTFEAPPEDARILDESMYAEIIDGREHVVKWTPQVIVRADAAPAPAPGDYDAWNALVASG